MLYRENSVENDVDTLFNRPLLSKKYKVILKKIPLTEKEEEFIVSIDFSIYYLIV